MTLFFCSHTLCAKCIPNLIQKKCPICSSFIEDSKPNWQLLRLVIQHSITIADDKQIEELDCSSLMEQARSLLDSNKLDQAILIIDKVLKNKPNNPSALYLKGKFKLYFLFLSIKINKSIVFIAICLQQTNEFKQSLDYLQKAIALDPLIEDNWKNSNLIKAKCFFGLEDYEQAVISFNKQSDIKKLDEIDLKVLNEAKVNKNLIYNLIISHLYFFS